VLERVEFDVEAMDRPLALPTIPGGRTEDRIPAAAAAGDEGMINLWAAGEPARSETSLDTLVRPISRIASI
jgi:hypothetical protein